MIRLLLFFKRIAPFLLFVVLELVAFSIYYSQNSYQRARMVAISSYLTGGIHSKLSDVSNYFNLGEQNRELLAENVRLHRELEMLRGVTDTMAVDSTFKIEELLSHQSDYRVVKVVNNSYTRLNNYITIAAGENQGIKPQMALFNSLGIVGFVKYCGENYSVAISLLNRRDFRTSGKVMHSGSLGSISWDGANYSKVIMDEIPSHAKIATGDTIVTTEYSNIFPAEIPIGVVDTVVQVTDVLKRATLSTLAKMSSLDYLYAVDLHQREEREEVEKLAEN